LGFETPVRETPPLRSLSRSYPEAASDRRPPPTCAVGLRRESFRNSSRPPAGGRSRALPRSLPQVRARRRLMEAGPNPQPGDLLRARACGPYTPAESRVSPDRARVNGRSVRGISMPGSRDRPSIPGRLRAATARPRRGRERAPPDPLGYPPPRLRLPRRSPGCGPTVRRRPPSTPRRAPPPGAPPPRPRPPR
jgi:hypothetical protein